VFEPSVPPVYIATIHATYHGLGIKALASSTGALRKLRVSRTRPLACLPAFPSQHFHLPSPTSIPLSAILPTHPRSHVGVHWLAHLARLQVGHPVRDECSLARHPFDCPRTPLTVSSYVGVLHEINSENHTVALERVTSFGTEDRKAPAETIPGSDQVYEYIVFRGSDVKELTIVAPPGAQPKENKPPQVPDDPAILGVRTHNAN